MRARECAKLRHTHTCASCVRFCIDDRVSGRTHRSLWKATIWETHMDLGSYLCLVGCVHASLLEGLSARPSVRRTVGSKCMKPKRLIHRQEPLFYELGSKWPTTLRVNFLIFQPTVRRSVRWSVRNAFFRMREDACFRLR